jgi:hypothetical protein
MADGYQDPYHGFGTAAIHAGQVRRAAAVVRPTRMDWMEAVFEVPRSLRPHLRR